MELFRIRSQSRSWNFDRTRDLWPLVLLMGVAMLGIISRLAIDIPNFKPIGAIAVFSGLILRDWRMALCLPLFVLAGSDLVLGQPETGLAISVYAVTAISVLIGHKLRIHMPTGFIQQLGAGVLAFLASSLVFFVFSNAAVWLTTDWYTHDVNGLSLCFVNAIPFFRFTIFADLVFGFLPFAGLVLASRIVAAKKTSLLPPVSNKNAESAMHA
ncbi:MAG: DUF6580 family putative transport protein [Pirellulaceae bacterium]